MLEDPFVKTALSAAAEIISEPLSIKQGASLLYQVTVNNKLEVSVNPQNPKRGQSAFQTDLCVFEKIDNEIYIPRVVLEFKKRLSTHDVIIYSTKARKHKQIYPYLRYGLIIGEAHKVPGKFFTHNEALDFCVAATFFKNNRLQEMFSGLLNSEINASRQLEKIAYGNASTQIFRYDISCDEKIKKVK